jgi:hypothetical protein
MKQGKARVIGKRRIYNIEIITGTANTWVGIIACKYGILKRLCRSQRQIHTEKSKK